MDKVIESAPAIALILLAIGLLGYVIALALAAFFPGALGGRGAQLAAWFTTAPAQTGAHAQKRLANLRRAANQAAFPAVTPTFPRFFSAADRLPVQFPQVEILRRRGYL
jgi:hypothetical protein